MCRYALTSAGSHRVWPFYSPVSAAKAALESLARSLAQRPQPAAHVANKDIGAAGVDLHAGTVAAIGAGLGKGQGGQQPLAQAAILPEDGRGQLLARRRRAGGCARGDRGPPAPRGQRLGQQLQRSARARGAEPARAGRVRPARRPSAAPPPISSTISRIVVPIGISISPPRRIFPASANTFVPLLLCVPMAANFSAPRRPRPRR